MKAWDTVVHFDLAAAEADGAVHMSWVLAQDYFYFGHSTYRFFLPLFVVYISYRHRNRVQAALLNNNAHRLLGY